MKKHLFSSLGLALMMLVWGGEAKADATYTKVSEVNFDSYQDNYIPNGWIVNNEGEIRVADTDYSSKGGPRLFTFSSSVQSYKKGLYFRAKSTNEGYAYYGTEDGYQLEIPTGNIELRVPAFLWTTGGTCKAKVSVLKYEAGKEIADLEEVASETQGLTYVGKDQDLSGVETIKVRFTNEEAGNFVVKVDAVNGDANWTEIVLAGYTLYTYEGTPSKYDDPLLVFEEKFADVQGGYAPGVGSGWTFYKAGTAFEKGADLSGDSRILKVANCADLASSFFFRVWGNNGTTYLVYGEGGDGEPTLTLSAGKYQISYYAANWSTTTAKLYFSLLKGSDVIYSRTDELINTAGEDKADAFDADHIQFTLNIEEDGDYQLKFYADQLAIMSSISVRQDVSVLIDENFSAVAHSAVPAVGSGWYMYYNGTLTEQGKTGLSGCSRFFEFYDNATISRAAYLGASYDQATTRLTYGEDGSGKTLSLTAGREYRISYYASNWDGSTDVRSLSCTIIGKDGEGTAFSRTDVLASTCNNQAWSAKFVTTPDFIETTFTPEKSGTYVLTFKGLATVVANIVLKDNAEDEIVYEAALDSKFGYSTLYLDRAVAIPSGVEAYVGKLNSTKTAVSLTQIEGTIPANTAVILKGKAGATVTFTAADDVDPIKDNILAGTITGTTLPTDATYYTLAYTDATDETTLGFYKAGATALRANKAYIALPAASSIASLRFDFDTDEPGNVTAIEQVKSEAAAGAIFDLNGRRVATMNKPGLYVVGGRKVLVK